MYTKSWFVIRDDGRRTFEVVTRDLSENGFINKAIAMQRDGLNVSYHILPVTNKNSNRESIAQTGYQREEGLYDRLVAEHHKIILKNSEEW